ncbi:MAG: hypothetical protein CVV13_00855 [Gammaproteobacteria bacterium HGW-Gammaproteobacteria-3]|nr:MAG: hypothetical protein CVV13_00855 [Gammaproteobacteria bacterium HGW-Gammaproteobacteria-3]
MEYLKHYVPLCWFKNNPLELPRSVGFFQKNLYFYILVELFIQMNITDPLEATIEVALETLLTLLFVAALLFSKKALVGFIPAATSFLVCENVVAAFVLPVMIWLTTTDDLLSYYIVAVLVLWDIALIVYLIKRILATPTPIAIALSLLYFTVTYLGAFSFMQIF